MPYIKKVYRFPNSIEVEKVFSGRYGKSIERSKNEKLTPSDVEKVNLRNAVKKLMRLIKMNFTSDDWSLTLTYSKDKRPDVLEARKVLRNFKAAMKRAYQKEGVPFKWIEVTEYKHKAIHHHMIVNDCNGQAVKLIKKLWNYGHVHYSPIWEDGEVEGLAEYYIKETKKSSKEEDGFRRTKYSRSRNLIIPVPEVTVIQAKEWRKEPKPIKGYYLDKSSLYEGISEVTGYRYQYYTMIKVERQRK